MDNIVILYDGPVLGVDGTASTDTDAQCTCTKWTGANDQINIRFAVLGLTNNTVYHSLDCRTRFAMFGGGRLTRR